MKWASLLKKPLADPPAAKVQLGCRNSRMWQIHMVSSNRHQISLSVSNTSLRQPQTLSKGHINDTITWLRTPLWRRRVRWSQELIPQTTSCSSSRTTWQVWDSIRWALRVVASSAWIYMTCNRWARPRTRVNLLSTNNSYWIIKISSTCNQITTTALPELHPLVLTTELISWGASQVEASVISFRS